ncbi:hypothetical protein DITRI_Ditri15bG0004300 [Diplodiscus trichospermus]
MGFILYLDTVLIPFCLFLTLGYHAYLWQNVKQKPSTTQIGLDKLRRKTWFLDIKQGDDKKGMLAVQSLRNTLMATILTASIAILINLSLAALTNNTYNASHLFDTKIFGSQSGRIYALKYGSASLLLLVSFLCSSMALGYLIDANFLINACAADDQLSSNPSYTQNIFEQGFDLALIGNRVLCITFPMLLWMFGPLPVALSSVALVWGLYEFDFAASNMNVKIEKTQVSFENTDH